MGRKTEIYNVMYTTTSTVKQGGGGVMVWTCFPGFGMVKIDRIIDSFVYHDIL